MKGRLANVYRCRAKVAPESLTEASVGPLQGCVLRTGTPLQTLHGVDMSRRERHREDTGFCVSYTARKKWVACERGLWTSWVVCKRTSTQMRDGVTSLSLAVRL